MVGLLPETNAAAETQVLLDAWDFKGRPAARSTTGRWGAAAMILVAELNERLTTLGIAVNLVTYLTATMHVGNAEAANVVTNFMGTSFMLCLLGGFVADSFLGRYLTIAIFTAVQASGVTILTISTAAPGLRPPPCSGNGLECARATGEQMGVLYLALYLTALGTGGLKSSVSGFGSDQFDEGDRGEKQQMMRFFNWFFFFISLGSLLAVTVLVYVQDNLGRPWGYGACAAAIAAGLVVFLAGTRRYRFKKLAGSPLTQIAAVVVAAWRKRRLELPTDPAMLYDIDIGKVAAAEEGSTKKSKLKQRLPHTEQFRFLDHAAINEEPAAEPSKWRLATLTDVEEVKTVVRMLPIWATTIMFWTVYAQMTTFSVSQATTMDRHIGASFQIPAGSLTVFFVGSILLTVPVYDRLVVPMARRLSGNPHGLTPLQRIGVGLVLSVIAMAAAALTEVKRLRVAQSEAVPAGGVVPISVFWLIPQFFLVGAGEAFTYIGQLDFFLRECPKGMKTMSTGLFLSTLSLGFFVSSALVAAVQKLTGDRRPWIADDLNQGRLYNFYWLLAALCLANLLVYLVAARWYKYKDGRAGADGSVNGVEMADAEPMLH
ncbi:protein NRT1/ PTR FAMILY 6.3-like [Phragmites australis]|uniref:protein NRT1/ PTR FAMILY 6.3-like n=1 Tax=Phragmites australis TaxID=29695 RepID=UPI002D7A005D|nr:protein NRT1/ PTR FAMILY 6.3-like [Phragmites australis]